MPGCNGWGCVCAHSHIRKIQKLDPWWRRLLNHSRVLTITKPIVSLWCHFHGPVTDIKAATTVVEALLEGCRNYMVCRGQICSKTGEQSMNRHPHVWHRFWKILVIGILTVQVFLLKIVEPGLLTKSLETLIVRLILRGICWRNVFIWWVFFFLEDWVKALETRPFTKNISFLLIQLVW